MFLATAGLARALVQMMKAKGGEVGPTAGQGLETAGRRTVTNVGVADHLIKLGKLRVAWRSGPFAIGNAVHLCEIAIGEIEHVEPAEFNSVTNRAKGGRAGGQARAPSLLSERRSEIAQSAATARWQSAPLLADWTVRDGEAQKIQAKTRNPRRGETPRCGA